MRGVLARAEEWQAVMEGEGLRSQAALARRLEVSVDTVYKTLRVLKEPEVVLEAIRGVRPPVTDGEYQRLRKLERAGQLRYLESRNS